MGGVQVEMEALKKLRRKRGGARWRGSGERVFSLLPAFLHGKDWDRFLVLREVVGTERLEKQQSQGRVSL